MPLAQILVWTAMGITIGYAVAFARFQRALARTVATSELLDRVVAEDCEIPDAVIDRTVDGILAREAAEPPAVALRPAGPVVIDTDRLWMLESSQRTTVPDSPAGARGPYQFLESTWAECTALMGVTWPWSIDAADIGKAEIVADYYINRRIPKMLNFFDLPDTIATRLACWNWGIGRVRRAICTYGPAWLSTAPAETRRFVADYETCLETCHGTESP